MKWVNEKRRFPVRFSARVTYMMLFVHFFHLSISLRARHKTALPCFSKRYFPLFSPIMPQTLLSLRRNLCKLIKLKCWWWKFFSYLMFPFALHFESCVCSIVVEDKSKQRLDVLSIWKKSCSKRNRESRKCGIKHTVVHMPALVAPSSAPSLFGICSGCGNLMRVSIMINCQCMEMEIFGSGMKNHHMTKAGSWNPKPLV